MNTLEMYKELSKEDKSNLSTYAIYDSIYNIAKNEDYDISDDEVERLKDIVEYVWLKDDYYHYSTNRIGDFLTECYVKHYIALDQIESTSWSDILDAIDNDDQKFLNNDMER